MHISAAPMEGLTGHVFRRIHQRHFPGIYTYYAPFLSPTADHLSCARGFSDILPENNEGIPLIPQLLANNAEYFIDAVKTLQEMGYREINFNIGCPSGTVVSKKKGSGFLSVPHQLDAFLNQIFSSVDVAISIKTRVGVSEQNEWPAILEIFSRYPIHELIIHPRIRADFYRAPVREDTFQYALNQVNIPICRSGDLFGMPSIQAFRNAYPEVNHIMLGRGLMANPALARMTDNGAMITKPELSDYLTELTETYRQTLSGDNAVLGRMKELWFYMGSLFQNSAKYTKAIRKSRYYTDYLLAVDALFRNCDLQKPDAEFFPAT